MQSEKRTREDFVKYRIETSEGNLKAAQVLFENGAFKDANNRAYYSIFHSITAVQAMDGSAYKRHKDAIANFNKDYVRPEIFPHEIGARISRAERIRNKSDYDDFYIATKEGTQDQIQTATDLLDMVKKYCKSREYGKKTKENVSSE